MGIRELLADKRDDIIAIARKHGARNIRVFGSVARDDATEHSDIDLLVCFDGPADFDRFMDLKLFLEDLLGRRIDLVTERALREEIRTHIQQDLLRVA